MAKLKLDKYYTEDKLAKYCVEKTFEILGSNWGRIIEPSAGAGSYLNHLPETTLAYDILPEDERITTQDYLELSLPYVEKSLVIGNPPFGRANKLSVKFVKKSLEHSDYISFIQPISQLNQNRTMKDTELLYSEDLGEVEYSGKPVHCCLNIYHKCIGGHRCKYDIPGLITCRHIFRTGKYKHNDALLNYKWDFRISAWGDIKLLNGDEICTNEVVIKCDNNLYNWLYTKLKSCDFLSLCGYVSTPNLPSWRLRKWLYEEYLLENKLTDVGDNYEVVENKLW